MKELRHKVNQMLSYFVDKYSMYFEMEEIWGEERMREITEHSDYMLDIEKDYLKNHVPKLERELREFSNDQGLILEVLRGKMEYNVSCLDRIMGKPGQEALKEKLIEKIEEQKEKVGEMEKRMNKVDDYGGRVEVDDRMIEYARERDITEFIDVNSKGYALCPFHDDKNPSFYVKNNYGYCFSCQKSANTLDIVMKTMGMEFIESVLYLNHK